MKMVLDHTQRLNLHALLGAQRADVGSIRAIWAVQDKLALDADEEENIESGDIYFTQVAPICCGRLRQSLRSTSPSTCTALVPVQRLARRDARRASLCYANFGG